MKPVCMGSRLAWFTLAMLVVIALGSQSAQSQFAQQRSEDLGALFQRAMGCVVKVTLKLDADAPQVDRQSLVEDDRKAMDHPLVSQVKDLFGAHVRAVERVEPSTREPE